MKKKLRKCSSSFARLKAPEKKPGGPKIHNFTEDPELRDELSEAVMVIVKQNMTRYDYRCGYEGVG